MSDRIAELLAAHRESYDSDCGDHYGCTCGGYEKPGVSEWADGWEIHRTAFTAHLADVVRAELDAARVAVKVQKGTDYARIGELAAQRAAVLRLCHEADYGWPSAVATAAIRRALGADDG